MWSSSHLAWLLCFSSIIISPTFAFDTIRVAPQSPFAGLNTLLSPNATVSNNTLGAPRWSEFKAPDPGAVVNVVTERDVQAVVCDESI